MAKTKYTERFEDVSEVRESQAEVTARINSKEKEDNTRREVARKFVDFYFWILILIVVGVPIYNYLVFEYTGNIDLTLSFKDAILTYSAVVGPTFGLVVAYYFKSGSES